MLTQNHVSVVKGFMGQTDVQSRQNQAVDCGDGSSGIHGRKALHIYWRMIREDYTTLSVIQPPVELHKIYPVTG